MWCDGIEQLKIRKTGKYSIEFKSNRWIGPENGSGNTTKGAIAGEVEISPSGETLKAYKMKIIHEGSIYIAKKLNKRFEWTAGT